MSEPDLRGPEGGEDAPALVLLHYFAGSRRAWRHVVERLPAAIRCVALDIPGFGDAPPLRAYSVADLARSIAETAAGLRLGRTVLVGHSMGAKLAMACAAAGWPGLVGLVLAAPSPPSPEPMDEGERARLLASHGDPASAERTLGAITRAGLGAADAALCVADNLRTSPAAWEWWLRSGSRETITGEVGRIACPVLVLSGGEDPVISPRTVDLEVMPRFPGARRVEIPGVGHLLPYEAARQTAAALQDFAASLPPRR